MELSDIFNEDNKDTPEKFNINKLMKGIEKAVLGVRTLENILLAFTQVGNEQSTKTFMTHGAIFKKITNYVIQSSISRSATEADKFSERKHNLGTDIANVAASVNTPFSDPQKIIEKNVYPSQSAPLKVALSVALNFVDSVTGNNGKFEDDFIETDKIMQMILVVRLLEELLS